MKRTIICIGIILILLLSSLSMSLANEETYESESFIDYDDDVFCYIINKENRELIYERTNSYPNINIINGNYAINEGIVTVSMEVQGVIEDKGNISTLPYVNGIGYSIRINTSNGTQYKNYDVSYCNSSYIMFQNYSLINVSVDGAILTVKFIDINEYEVINEILLYALVFENNANISKTIADIASSNDYSFSVDITKPINAFYCCNKNILPLSSPFILGDIKIEYLKIGGENPFTHWAEYSELYVNDELLTTPDIENNLIYNKPSFGHKTIKILLFDVFGNRASDEMEVWKFF